MILAQKRSPQPKLTKPNAPGPVAMRKRDWKPIANQWLRGRNIILHTDGARAYRMKVAGVVLDSVVHMKKRVVLDGKPVWLKPAFTKVLEHTLPGIGKVRVKASTQIIDRFWRSLRAELEGVSCKVDSPVITNRNERKSQAENRSKSKRQGKRQNKGKSKNKSKTQGTNNASRVSAFVWWLCALYLHVEQILPNNFSISLHNFKRLFSHNAAACSQ